MNYFISKIYMLESNYNECGGGLKVKSRCLSCFRLIIIGKYELI